MGWVITSGHRKPEFEVVLKGNFKAEWSDVTDAAGYYSATEVEAVLQEIGEELLVHNLGGFEDNSESTLSWDSTTYTMTITAAGTGFHYWCAGVHYVEAGPLSRQITDVSGTHVLYMDGTTFTSIANPTHNQLEDVIINKAIVAYVYWNTNSDTSPIVADERHGCQMSGETHHWMHDAHGATFGTGGAISGYTLNDDSDTGVSFALTNLDFYDEDIEHEIENAASADSQYEQILADTAYIPVLYRDDVDGSWVEDAASALPYKIGAALLAHNKDDGDGTWSQHELSNNEYMNFFLVATHDWQFPIKMIQGSTSYTVGGGPSGASAGQAAEIAGWGTLPMAECIVLYGIICQTAAAFGGTKKLKIISVVDYRYQGITGAAYSPTDHGVLSGLSDDDHPQYILHSLADAANDFLVASGADTFVKKTLAETGAILEGDIDHDNLVGFAANEHKDHTGITAIAGGILSGGGTIDTDFTISLANADIDHDSTSNYVANKHIDHTGVSVIAGNGLTGGGDISADRTLNVVGGKGIAVAADSCYLDVTDTNWLHDEDDMASNSASHAATQQSIKAYADTKLALTGGSLTGALTISAADDILLTLTSTDTACYIEINDDDTTGYIGVSDSNFGIYGNAQQALIVLDTKAANPLLTTLSTGDIDVANSSIIKDEDDMASDSASHLATQQSIKKYVDDNTAQSLPADPGKDAIVWWDDSASSYVSTTSFGDAVAVEGQLSVNDNIVITNTGYLQLQLVSSDGAVGIRMKDNDTTCYIYCSDSSYGFLTGGGSWSVRFHNSANQLTTDSNGIVVATSSIVLDEDNMASNSAVKLATQQSIKAYVDTQFGVAKNYQWDYLSGSSLAGATEWSYSIATTDYTFWVLQFTSAVTSTNNCPAVVQLQYNGTTWAAAGYQMRVSYPGGSTVATTCFMTVVDSQWDAADSGYGIVYYFRPAPTIDHSVMHGHAYCTNNTRDYHSAGYWYQAGPVTGMRIRPYVAGASFTAGRAYILAAKAA